MKKIYIFLLAALMAVPSIAQISTGEPHYNVIPRTGNRPTANTWGMYLGISANQIADMIKSKKYIEAQGGQGWAYAIPAINLKYYATDNFEVRLGFQFSANSASFAATDTMSLSQTTTTTEKTGNNYTRFIPGFAYHFNKTNIVDVYLGATMPIGWNAETNDNSVSSPVSLSSSKEYTSTFAIGAGVVLGLQFFIADLPFAIGIETGFAGYLYAGGATKHIDTVGDDSATQKTQTYYTHTKKEGAFSNVISTEARWGADAAITFTYFFK